MSAREFLGAPVKVLGTAATSITDATTVALDFGSPNDLDLRNLSYNSGDRLLVVATVDSDGTTSQHTISVQDAPDSAGSIGAVATALTDESVANPAATGTADGVAIIGIRVQSDRPWLRINLTSSSAVDTAAVHCTVLALPPRL